MLLRNLTYRVLNSYMISMNGIQHQTSVCFGTETDILAFGLFLIAYTAVLWYTIN